MVEEASCGSALAGHWVTNSSNFRESGKVMGNKHVNESSHLFDRCTEDLSQSGQVNQSIIKHNTTKSDM